MKHLFLGKADKRRWNSDQLSCQVVPISMHMGVYWAGSFNQNANLVSLLIIQALSRLSARELMADRFLNTKSVVVPAETQSQTRKNAVQFISISKGNNTIFPESQALGNTIDCKILREAEADILPWKRYSSYTALLTGNTSTKKYFAEFILSQIKITEEYRRDTMVNIKKIK